MEICKDLSVPDGGMEAILAHVIRRSIAVLTSGDQDNLESFAQHHSLGRLLEAYGDILTDEREQSTVLKQLIMDLTEVLMQHSISSVELFAFFQLFRFGESHTFMDRFLFIFVLYTDNRTLR